MAAWRALACFAAAAILLLMHTAAPAQVPAPAAPQPAGQNPPPGLYTLHVYANLAQVPTLIVTPDSKPLPKLTPSEFFVSLDGGLPFHPSQLRIEGDDPISLAIIIDDSGGQPHFLDKIADLLSKLAPKDLHPKDHVSVYAIDCKAIQYVDDAPASAQLIHDAVSTVLEAPTLHGEKHKAACPSAVHLWDILGHAISKLGESPSRRAVLLISLGLDAGSNTTFDEVTRIAQVNSTAVFGMRDIEEYSFQRGFREQTRSGLSGENSEGHASDSLSRLGALTGGIVFDDKHFQIEDQLHRFIAMLRNRYIVEFPRPDDSIPGMHQIQISIPSKWYYVVRYTGASIPLPDPSIASDPTTVPSSKSPATFGNKRPVEPKH